MSKSVTISFVDCCLPDYFNGSSKPILQYPVDGITTRKQLYDGLLSELAEGVIDYEIDENRLEYDDIRQAIKDCIYFKPECKDDDILFPDLELWTDDNDNCDSCYAFFIVDWNDNDE